MDRIQNWTAVERIPNTSALPIRELKPHRCCGRRVVAATVNWAAGPVVQSGSAGLRQGRTLGKYPS